MKLPFRTSAAIVALFTTLVVIMCTGRALAAPVTPAGATGGLLPDPPMQSAPWTAPADEKSADLIKATQSLYDLGLADPRGLEYRQVKLTVDELGMGFRQDDLDEHAWVLPNPTPGPSRSGIGDTQKYAVCWNGLVMPIESAGDPASLADDIAATLAAPVPRFPRGSEAIPADSAVDATARRPVRVALLLRLGDVADADKLYAQIVAGSGMQAGDGDQNYDPVTVMQDDYQWYLFDRAVNAHVADDTLTSLAACRQLKAVTDALGIDDSTIAVRKDPMTPNRNEFLSVLPALLADEERRAAAGPRKPSILEAAAEEDFGPTTTNAKPQYTAAGQAMSQHDRIWALISELDEVDAQQHSQPGGVDLADDPIVAALIYEGAAAVDPLLDVLTRDPRLTRSVHYGRSFFRERSVIGVPEAAYVALCGIVQHSFFGAGSTGDDLTQHSAQERAQLATEIRAYWDKYKDLSLPERWYRTLADDSVSTDEWTGAMAHIVAPANETVQRGSMFGTDWESVPAGGPSAALAGESLRAKRSPSVLELALRRVTDIDHRASTSTSDDIWITQAADQMALSAWEWDPAGALPALGKQVGVVFDFMSQPYPYDNSYLYGDIAGMTLARMKPLPGPPGSGKGDSTAQAEADYVRLLGMLKPNGMPSFGDSQVFEPVWRYPNDPVFNAKLDGMFAPSAKLWRYSSANDQPAMMVINELLNTPMIGVPAFRRMVIRALQNDSPNGSTTVDADGNFQIGYGGGSSGGDRLAPGAKAPSGTVTYTVADSMAEALSNVEGFPQVQVISPPAARKDAIRRDIDLLTHYGGGYAYCPGYPPDIFEIQAHLVLPVLGRPATAGDVAAGRALFALGPGARLVGGLRLPVNAQLTGGPGYEAPQQNEGDLNEGRIYQAEMLPSADGTAIYFGFVGKHWAGKVAAADIEFDSPAPSDEWTDIGCGLRARAVASAPQIQAGNGMETVTYPAKIVAGRPLTVTVMIHNAQPFSQRVATDWYQSSPPRLRTGLTMSLILVGPGKDSIGDIQGTALTPKITATFAPSASTRMLEPNQVMTAFTLNLGDWFDISKPGEYFLTFPLAGAPGAAKDMAYLDFAVTPPPAGQ